MFILEYVEYFIEYILRDPFTQIMGFMGMFILLIALYQKDDYTVKKLLLLSSLFWGTHYYLLGMYAGLAAVIIFVFRLVLSVKFEKNKKIFLALIAVIIISGYFTFTGIASLIPVMTSITGAYAYFFLQKIQLRFAMVFNSLSWLTYTLIIGSISGVMNEIFVQIMLASTIYRMLHPEGGSHYYAEKIKGILWKKRRVDYDRFVFLHNRITHYRTTIGQHFLQVLHYDLRIFFRKKKGLLSKKLSH